MFEFAQTNLQLFRQMDEQEYCQQDRERVASAYRQLMPMFSGLYRGNEKPFLAHLVGTASILVSGRLQVERVLAGLLHAVYMAGDFGFQPGRRQTRRKRQLIRELAGEEVESIIAANDAAHWNVESVRSLLSMSDALSELDRSLVTLHLANALEDFLDDGMSCCSASKLEKMSCPEMQHGMLTLSHSHAWPALSISLERAMSDFNAGRASVDRAGFMGKSALIPPPSAGSIMLATGWGWLVRRLRRLKALVRRDPLSREL